LVLRLNQETRTPRRPCGQHRPHTVTPDLLIIRTPSTQPVRLSLILYTMSLIPVMILVADRYATPVTCTPRDKQTWFSKRNKDRGSRTTEISRIQIQISTSQWLIKIKPKNWSLGFSDNYHAWWIVVKMTITILTYI
jgi:hypothetical protein